MSGATLQSSLGQLSGLWRDLHAPLSETVLAAVERLRGAGDEGALLAQVLDAKKTRIAFSPLVAGGLTLNPLNAIFLQKSMEDYQGADFDVLVALLAHEARHIEQGYWVDSIAQELCSYQTQVRIGAKLGLDFGPGFEELMTLKDSRVDLPKAQELIVGLFPGSPAQVLYEALDEEQPFGLIAIGSAIKQLRALSRAAQQVQP